MNPVYKRVLLKVSGEALFDLPSDDSAKSMMEFMLGEVSRIHALGIEISIVIGGGNIMRGIKKDDENIHDRVTADQIGMLATVINALRFADALEFSKIKTTVMTSFRIDGIADVIRSGIGRVCPGAIDFKQMGIINQQPQIAFPAQIDTIAQIDKSRHSCSL